MSAATDRFGFFNFGFFVYMLAEDDRCSRIVIPKMELVPHANVLWLPAKNAKIKGFLPATPAGDYLVVRMHDLSMSINGEGSARLSRRSGKSMDEADFDWVPNVSKAFCGIKLNRDWPESPVVDSVVTLGEGMLSALPDGHTMDRRWTWEMCNGQSHTQRVTTFTAFEPDSSPIRIVFTETATGAWVAEATFAADPELPVFHCVMPAANLEGKDVNQADVEFSHVQAVMRLCVRTTEELRAPRRRFSDTPGPDADPPKKVPDIFGRLRMFHQGTIECSGQSVPPPDPEP